MNKQSSFPTIPNLSSGNSLYHTIENNLKNANICERSSVNNNYYNEKTLTIIINVIILKTK